MNGTSCDMGVGTGQGICQLYTVVFTTVKKSETAGGGHGSEFVLSFTQHIYSLEYSTLDMWNYDNSIIRHAGQWTAPVVNSSKLFEWVWCQSTDVEVLTGPYPLSFCPLRLNNTGQNNGSDHCTDTLHYEPVQPVLALHLSLLYVVCYLRGGYYQVVWFLSHCLRDKRFLERALLCSIQFIEKSRSLELSVQTSVRPSYRSWKICQSAKQRQHTTLSIYTIVK